MHVCVKLHWTDSPKFHNRINEHKFDQRSEVCKHLLANPKHRFNFKQPEILGSIAKNVIIKTKWTAQWTKTETSDARNQIGPRATPTCVKLCELENALITYERLA